MVKRNYELYLSRESPIVFLDKLLSDRKKHNGVKKHHTLGLENLIRLAIGNDFILGTMPDYFNRIILGDADMIRGYQNKSNGFEYSIFGNSLDLERSIVWAYDEGIDPFAVIGSGDIVSRASSIILKKGYKKE
jgi:hypothetical protein